MSMIQNMVDNETTRQSDIMKRKKDWMKNPRGNNRASDALLIQEEMTDIAQRQDTIEENDPSLLPPKHTSK